VGVVLPVEHSEVVRFKAPLSQLLEGAVGVMTAIEEPDHELAWVRKAVSRRCLCQVSRTGIGVEGSAQSCPKTSC
jgi:hypothetical protein